MDNPETMTILATQDTRRRQTKQKHNTTQKSKKDEQHGPYQSPRMILGAGAGQAVSVFCYKTTSIFNMILYIHV